ncbi:hypothetical protein [Pseudonocardia zijingensis]|uniref:hypothetical protein n=1 Tax=Pseudonocardia zijingensis TaxID=153376 RepID=UPI00360EF9D5
MRTDRHSALPRSRAGRAAGAVAAALATTAGGHALATGAPPPLVGLLLTAAVLAGPAWWLTGGERGWERLAGAQLAAQFGGHALFVLTAADPAAHAGHGRQELVLLVHVLGAAAAGAWLRRGERRAVAAARRTVALLRSLFGRLPREWRGAHPLTAAFPAGAPFAALPGVRLRHSIVHRGPPAICL